jgi:hypothetical protein
MIESKIIAKLNEMEKIIDEIRMLINRYEKEGDKL